MAAKLVLRLASKLTLPLDTVTQTLGIVAKRRAGKSYTARRVAEQLSKAGQQIVVIDPKGDWWGIRSAADGKGPGLPIIILGGERGDVALEVGSGEIVAKLVTEERVSVVLDLSLFRKHEVATFMTAFLENLYRLKAQEKYRTPLMLVIDEADAVAPQKPQKNEARMLGAAEDIVRRGGQRGIGCTLITQRSAVLNKNVLTQIQILIALRTIAPQDLAALNAWVDVHGTEEQRDTLMESLPSLPVGDAWFWSPGWPTTDGIFHRVTVLPIETFDSGATPKPGEKRVEPRNLADVDLDALRRQMAATIERTKASDPKELRKQLASARQELLAKQVELVRALESRDLKIKEVPVLKESDFKRLAKLESHLESELMLLREKLHAIALKPLREPQATIHGLSPREIQASITRDLAGVHKPVPALPKRLTDETDKTLAPRHQEIINAIAFYAAIGVPQCDKAQVAGFVTRSFNGNFRSDLAVLRTAGLVDYPTPGDVILTDAGKAAITMLPSIATQTDLHNLWLAKLAPRHAEILRTLLAAGRVAVGKPLLAENLGREFNGNFRSDLSVLRTLGVIDYPSPGTAQVSENLFPPIPE